jgi:hypothetical protein
MCVAPAEHGTESRHIQAGCEAFRLNVLHMAYGVQISNKFSVKHEPNYLIFLLPFFSISQIKKFGGLANIP